MPKKAAQTVLRELTKTQLLEHGVRLRTDNDTVLIPTTRTLSLREAGALSKLVPGLKFQEDAFERIAKPPTTLEEALSDQIPGELVADIPRSFDVIGDIAVIETPPTLSGYEKAIAESVMRLQPSVRAVFAKAGEVSGEDRVRPLRHLAGEERTETIHHEFGCAFKLDLSRVFFSPRLSAEHERIARQVGRGESVVDMFAGIGPFSILIAKRVPDAKVDAIDSNDVAVKFVRENVRLNKVSERVHVHIGDARAVVEGELRQTATRVIMNHPSRANEFLDVACSALQKSGGTVHYYRFVGGRDWEAKTRTEFDHGLEQLGYRTREIAKVRQVREVGPLKWQVALDAYVVRIR